MNMQATELHLCVCVCMCVLVWVWVCMCVCFLRFPLIELVLLNVQYSVFRLMVELIFLTLLCLLCVYVHVFV